MIAFLRRLFRRDYDWRQADAALKKILTKHPGGGVRQRFKGAL